MPPLIEYRYRFVIRGAFFRWNRTDRYWEPTEDLSKDDIDSVNTLAYAMLDIIHDIFPDIIRNADRHKECWGICQTMPNRSGQCAKLSDKSPIADPRLSNVQLIETVL